MSINKIPFMSKHEHLFSELEDRRSELSAAQEAFGHDLDRVMSALDKRLWRIVHVTRAVLRKELGRVPSRDVFSDFVPSELAWVHPYHSLITYYGCRVVDLSVNTHEGKLVITLRWPKRDQSEGIIETPERLLIVEIPAHLLSASEGDVAGDIRRFLKLKDLRERILDTEKQAANLDEMRAAFKELSEQATEMSERISELESGEATKNLYDELRNAPQSNLMRLKQESRRRA